MCIRDRGMGASPFFYSKSFIFLSLTSIRFSSCIRPSSLDSAPVSYTHLRADIQLLKDDKEQAVKDKEEAEKRAEKAEKDLCSLEAVSYTHLDVYKRQ